MVSSIFSNIAALSAQTNIGNAQNSASSSISRLSSGQRIVKASDDVAGLAVGTSLATQVGNLRAAIGNASQGSSLLQVADGGLAQITDILQRQRSIAAQAGSGSLTDTNRAFLDQEFQALTAQINQIASTTNFNGVNLLSGGLGTTSRLSTTNVLSATFNPTAVTGSTAGVAVASTVAVQAFNANSGASLAFVTATAGTVSAVDSANAILANAAYDSVNSAVSGQFSNFRISNVTYGATTTGSATISVDIGGVTFTGTTQGGVSDFNVSNGSTILRLSAGATTNLDFTNAGSTQFSQNTLATSFANTTIQRTQTIQGVDFAGTRLAGAVGTAANGGNVSVRLNSGNAVISNFQYAGNIANTANSSRITVQVNGETFTASGVLDVPAAATPRIFFQGSQGQGLIVDITGLTTPFTGDNLRTNTALQSSLINALNQGFSRAGSGLSFAVGSTASATVGVTLGSATTASLFNGQTLGVGTSPAAAAASNALDAALNTVNGLRSTVGALQSRFNFISANLDTSVQNQDAARSALLDTDVSAESTAYATAQVQLQAGIAVLAQANQLPQNLLKLIQ
ncbi:MAG: flagellin [Rickettsiales bacterium]